MFRSKFLLTFVLAVAIVSVAFASEEFLKKGRSLQREKKFEEALQLYKKAIKQSPSEDLYVDAGSLLGKMQKYENAQTILEKGLQIYPQSKSLKNLLALISFRKGDKVKAKTLLTEVLAADEKNGFAKKWLEKIEKGIAVENEDSLASSPDEISSDDGTDVTSDGVFKVNSSLPVAEQKELAKKLYTEMMDLEKWELDSFKDLHRQVIEKCPLTDQAEESCWRLSNLALLGEEPPDFQGIIDVLEHLLKQYPDTPLFPDAKNRLMIAYQKSGQNEKLVSLYEELFTRDPDPVDDKVFMVRALEFADALVAVGRNADAQAWYQKVLEKDDGKDSLEARVAQERLAGGD